MVSPASDTPELDEALAKLKPKQQAFVIEYIKDFNGTQAAIRASYSKRSAAEQAYDLLRLPQIQNAIRIAIASRKNEAIADIAERQTILTEIARGRCSDYLFCGKDGSYISFGDDSPNQRAVAGITTHTKAGDTNQSADGKKAKSEDTIIQKIDMRDPVKAIDVLNKMDRLYIQQIEVSTSEDLQAFLATIDGASMGPPAKRKK